MNDLCGISATPRGRGNEEISVETRFRGQCRSGFHRSLGSEAVSCSGVRCIVDRMGRSIMCSRHVRRSAFVIARCTASVGIKPSFSCVTMSMCDAGLLVDPLADAEKPPPIPARGACRLTHAGTSSAHWRVRKPPGQAYQNDVVFVAVQDGDRNMHVADREVRAKPIQHQPIHRKDRIMRRGNFHRRRRAAS
jgi:hypothetical protein